MFADRHIDLWSWFEQLTPEASPDARIEDWPRGGGKSSSVELGTTYASHDVLTDAPLECADEGTHSAGTILVRMKLAAAPIFTEGVKYPFTIRVFGSDGLTQDDRTLWLRVKSR